MVEELKSFSVGVDVHDPYASSDEVKHEYGFELIDEIGSKKYDAVIVAVNHSQYADYKEADFKNLLVDGGLLVDLKGTYRGQISDLDYWSL